MIYRFTTSTFAQNTTGNKTAASGGNPTAGNTTAGNSSSSSSSSATPKATASPPPSTAGPKYPALEPMVAYHESNHNKLQQGLLIVVLHSGNSFFSMMIRKSCINNTFSNKVQLGTILYSFPSK